MDIMLVSKHQKHWINHGINKGSPRFTVIYFFPLIHYTTLKPKIIHYIQAFIQKFPHHKDVKSPLCTLMK